jgi:hypothetical protein
MILWVILAGVLIYLCIYLTQYSPKDITLQSATNTTNHTSNHIAFAPIAINKQAVHAEATIQPTSSAITLKKAQIPPTFTRVTLPTLTQVAVPSKPLRKVTYVPETIELTDVTPTT